jgi:hypothetical protein
MRPARTKSLQLLFERSDSFTKSRLKIFCPCRGARGSIGFDHEDAHVHNRNWSSRANPLPTYCLQPSIRAQRSPDDQDAALCLAVISLVRVKTCWA